MKLMLQVIEQRPDGTVLSKMHQFQKDSVTLGSLDSDLPLRDYRGDTKYVMFYPGLLGELRVIVDVKDEAVSEGEAIEFEGVTIRILYFCDDIAPIEPFAEKPIQTNQLASGFVGLSRRIVPQH